MTTAYDFSFNDLRGRPLSLAQFSGQPLLVVNTASRCGFTPQYAGLEQIWRAYQDKGLIVLGVPCNDFGGQEPGDAATIAGFCVARFGIDFPLTAKVHVRGSEAHPLFQWLGREGGFLARPRWNFYKYLIGRDGRLRDWYSSLTAPSTRRFTRAIDAML